MISAEDARELGGLKADLDACLRIIDDRAATIRDLREKGAALLKRAETAERCADQLSEESV